MTLMDELFRFSNNTEELASFINKNSIKLYDFFISQKNSSILSYRYGIEKYILPKYQVYSKLDFNAEKNKSFILLLFDVSERFALATEFERLFNLSKKNGIKVSNRIRAASYFLKDVHNITDYSNRLMPVLKHLSVSYLEEDDNEQKSIATLVHLYTEVFNNFGRHNKLGVESFRNKFIETLNQDDFSFLYTSDIKEITSYSLNNIDALYKAVKYKLDEILERSSEYLEFSLSVELIEKGTIYVNELQKLTEPCFSDILSLTKRLYSVVKSDQIFYSLQRGIKVLTEQNQLLAYNYSYGDMHYNKLIYSFDKIDKTLLSTNLQIFDWGCGQGLGSFSFLEYVKKENIDSLVKDITLIEPSEIALKRAALHVRIQNDNCKIFTINRDLDSLNYDDFSVSNRGIKIHLFSNILDIDLFSMSDLIDNIKNKFKGENLFICVSPYISSIKTQRLENFMSAFSGNRGYQIISKITESKGEWVGTNWLRIIRLFKCII